MIPPVQRARMSEVIRRRARVTPVVAVLLSLGFALAVAPIALVDAWLAPPTVVAGQPADLTIRVPAFEGWDDHKVSGRGGSVVIARGEIATPRQASSWRRCGRLSRRPAPGWWRTPRSCSCSRSA